MSTLLLEVGTSRIRATLGGWSAEMPYDGLTDLEATVRRILAATDSRSTLSVTVLIEPPLVQQRRLNGLPRVGRRDLRALVGQQQARFFRRSGPGLVVDAAWLPRRSGEAPAACAAAADAPLVTAISEGITRAGMKLAGIRPAGEGPARQLQLLDPAELQSRGRAGRKQLFRLALATAGMWLLVAAVYAVRLNAEQRRITADLEPLREPLRALSAVRRESRRAQEMLDAIESDRTRRTRLLSRLKEIANALPDSAYLTELRIEVEGTGTLTGEATRDRNIEAALARADGTAREDPATATPGTARPGWAGFRVHLGSRRAR